MAVLAAAISSSLAKDTNKCASGLYMIAARGTGEDAGPGSIGDVADNVADRVKGSEVVGLDYPASLTDPIYFESVEEGGEAMKKAVEDYHSACPDGKVAIFGYSQGAQITMDAFCGGSGGLGGGGDLEPLASNVVNPNVVAIVLFGDPSHVANTTYDKGTSKNDGIFSRRNITLCENLGPRLVSYCDTGDVFCDAGELDEVHGGYVERYGSDVVDFVVSQYNDGGNDDASTSTSVAPTSSHTGASTTETSGTATETSSTATGTETGGAEETGDSDGDDGGDDDSGAVTLGAGFAALVPLGLAALWQVL
jgi:acetylxylan esterase